MDSFTVMGICTAVALGVAFNAIILLSRREETIDRLQIALQREKNVSDGYRRMLGGTALYEAAIADEPIPHGHVTKRDDGHKARCGGPVMCRQCRAEWTHAYGMPYPLKGESLQWPKPSENEGS